MRLRTLLSLSTREASAESVARLVPRRRRAVNRDSLGRGSETGQPDGHARNECDACLPRTARVERVNDSADSGTHCVRKKRAVPVAGIEYGLVAPVTSVYGPATLLAVCSLAGPLHGTPTVPPPRPVGRGDRATRDRPTLALVAMSRL